MRRETLAARAAHQVDPATGAVTAPVHLSTTFERAPDGGYPLGYTYARAGNPNRALLEDRLAALEGGAGAACFASGMAAAGAVFHTLAAGDHVIAPSDCYHGTAALLRDVFARWGLEASFVDLTDEAQLTAALRPNTGVVWVETPSNPLLKITDVERTAAIAHEAGALCVCDNTWATPMLQRPIETGADAVVHSTTKYVGGHGDLTGGAVVCRDDSELLEGIRRAQSTYGAVPSAFDCWLALRGMRTLHLRMRAHSENAARVAEFLNAHPRVEAVHYPGLPGHPGRETAARQMDGFGGMVSFQVAGGREEAMRVAAGVRLFTRATSLGGTESLIEHRASIEGPHTRTPQNLLRASIGLEHADDLIEDLAQALG